MPTDNEVREQASLLRKKIEDAEYLVSKTCLFDDVVSLRDNRQLLLELQESCSHNARAWVDVRAKETGTQAGYWGPCYFCGRQLL